MSITMDHVESVRLVGDDRHFQITNGNDQTVDSQVIVHYPILLSEERFHFQARSCESIRRRSRLF
jgi:hypothetical protein